jgi:hypothetical protein
MAGPATYITTDALKRRSTRIVRAVALTVTGVDALGRSFAERTCTSIVSCHGGRYQSKHYVSRSEWVTLEVLCPESARAGRRVRGRVTWIQRPRAAHEPFQFGVELEVSGNFWGIACCPPDWFPFPEGAGPKAPLAEMVPESMSPEQSATWPGAATARTGEGRTSQLGSGATMGSESSGGAPLPVQTLLARLGPADRR